MIRNCSVASSTTVTMTRLIHFERRGFMSNLKNRLKLVGFTLLVMLCLTGTVFTVLDTVAVTVQAATDGFVTTGGKTYYYKNGKKLTGWQEISGKTYYFDNNGVMATGWMMDANGNKRYFNKKTGAMNTGWVKFTKGRRYFDPSTGIMKTGWLKLDGNRYYLNKNGYAVTGFRSSNGKIRYFYSGSGAMARGWLTNSKGEKRYFFTSSSASKDGVMATKFQNIKDETYYFYSGSGKMATGWVENKKKGIKYYFDEETGIMATGTVTIDKTKHMFGDDGIYIGPYSDGTPDGPSNNKKTIKNYLLGALQPVGRALYVWGGGWTDSTLKGVSQQWVDFYNSQSSSYSFGNTSVRKNGLDCSGFVGWAAYQVMHTKSGVGSGYTVVSGDVGYSYQNRGWGSVYSSKPATLKAGDIGFNGDHVWIVIGQCSDGSVVLVHSTNDAGCQIAGTGYGSQAHALAQKYMSRYSGYKKYNYYTSVGSGYANSYSYFRWNRETLADPDGYTDMTADKILADLFAS